MYHGNPFWVLAALDTCRWCSHCNVPYHYWNVPRRSLTEVNAPCE